MTRATRAADWFPLLGEPSTYVDDLVRAKKLVFVVGPRGSGRTTIATALGLATSALGRNVLVVTSRPARKLRETLGLPSIDEGAEPYVVNHGVLGTASPSTRGTLSVLPLSPEKVFERFVRRFVGGETRAEAVVRHPIFRAIAGVAEHLEDHALVASAVDALAHGTHDIVVIDVPASRGPLRCLEAPRDVAKFFEESVIAPFSSQKGALLRTALDAFESTFSQAFGEGHLEDVRAFLEPLASRADALLEEAEAVRTQLSSQNTAFVVVTTSEASSLDEAFAIHAKLQGKGLPFAGYVLNRSWAYTRGFADPASTLLDRSDETKHVVAMRKVLQLADIERYRAQRDRTTLARLSMEAESGAAMAIPHVGDGAMEAEGLERLARNLVHLDLP